MKLVDAHPVEFLFRLVPLLFANPGLLAQQPNRSLKSEDAEKVARELFSNRDYDKAIPTLERATAEEPGDARAGNRTNNTQRDRVPSHRGPSPRLGWWAGTGTDPIALADALHTLSASNSRKRRVIELRLFRRMSVNDAAEALNETEPHDWKLVHSWLRPAVIASQATSMYFIWLPKGMFKRLGKCRKQRAQLKPQIATVCLRGLHSYRR